MLCVYVCFYTLSSNFKANYAQIRCGVDNLSWHNIIIGLRQIGQEKNISDLIFLVF